jgi:hypothetical protein
LTETFDGVSGWDELVVLELAIAMLDTEESDTSSLKERRNRAEKRIMLMSQNRDMGMPSTITDTETQVHYNVRNTVRYRLYGDTMEFISVEYLGGYFP